MPKLKKLRKVAEKLSYRVQIAEQRQRLAELQQTDAQPMGFMQRKETRIMGAPPIRTTKADKRLGRNNPNAGKGKPAPGKGGNRPATPPGQVRKAK